MKPSRRNLAALAAHKAKLSAGPPKESKFARKQREAVERQRPADPED